MTHTNSRLYFGNVQSNLPSRFLDEIPEELTLRLGVSRGGRSRNFGNFSAKDVNDYLDEMDSSRKNFNWD